MREVDIAQQMIRSAGMVLTPVELSRRGGELICIAPIDWHLRHVLVSYERLARHAEMTAQVSLQTWALERCRIHATQPRAVAIVLDEARLCGPW